MELSWSFDLVVALLLGWMVYLTFKLRLSGVDSEAVPATLDLRLLDNDNHTGFKLYPRKLIRHAGLNPTDLVLVYWLIKAALCVLLPMLWVEFGPKPISTLQIILVALGGFFVFDLYLFRRRAKRRLAIQQSLSFFVDLIVTFLNTGVSLPQAINHAAMYGLPQKNPLANEVMLIAKELEAGGDRNEAFLTLADRTGVEDLVRLSSLLSMGLGRGAPIVDTLETQADMLREKQLRTSLELGNKKSLEAMFPMMLVSLPMFFVLVLFPALAQIHEAYSIFKSTL